MLSGARAAGSLTAGVAFRDTRITAGFALLADLAAATGSGTIAARRENGCRGGDEDQREDANHTPCGYGGYPNSGRKGNGLHGTAPKCDEQSIGLSRKSEMSFSYHSDVGSISPTRLSDMKSASR